MIKNGISTGIKLIFVNLEISSLLKNNQDKNISVVFKKKKSKIENEYK